MTADFSMSGLAGGMVASKRTSHVFLLQPKRPCVVADVPPMTRCQGLVRHRRKDRYSTSIPDCPRLGDRAQPSPQRRRPRSAHPGAHTETARRDATIGRPPHPRRDRLPRATECAKRRADPRSVRGGNDVPHPCTADARPTAHALRSDAPRLRGLRAPARMCRVARRAPT